MANGDGLTFTEIMAMTHAEHAATIAVLVKELDQLIKYADWQIREGGSHHPTLPSAIGSARAAIAAMPGEPVAWQYRYPTDSGAMSKWVDIPRSIYETLDDLTSGNCERWMLYAAPAMPATDAVREAELPVPSCTYADHSYPAFSKEQMIAYGKACAALSHPSQGGWQPADVDLRELVLQVILATEGDTKRLNEAVQVVAATFRLPAPPEVQP